MNYIQLKNGERAREFYTGSSFFLFAIFTMYIMEEIPNLYFYGGNVMSILTDVIDEKERQAFIDNLCDAYMTIPEIHPEIELSEDECYTVTRDYNRNITVTVACKKINDKVMEIDHVSIIVNGTEYVTKFSKLYESLILCDVMYGENADNFRGLKQKCSLEFAIHCCSPLPNERFLLMTDGHWIKEEKN